MIISASRRTDLPNYYSEWFYNRIREGFLYVRNPFNPHHVSRIDLSPQVVDCIVFWTKNPAPMLDGLQELKEYPYYFQFTLTGYGKDIERNVPHKKNEMIPVFKKLSGLTGSDRVIWRYDPILLNDTYNQAYHLKAFKQIAEHLRGYTKRCVISFIDTYPNNRKILQSLGMHTPDPIKLMEFAKELSEIASDNQIEIMACAEKTDLSPAGIRSSCCIDRQLIEHITGCRLNVHKDNHQREECGCMESVDIGCYGTCGNGCIYCYANDRKDTVLSRMKIYDPASLLLCSTLTDDDKITYRRTKSFREGQLTLFDQ